MSRPKPIETDPFHKTLVEPHWAEAHTVLEKLSEVSHANT